MRSFEDDNVARIDDDDDEGESASKTSFDSISAHLKIIENETRKEREEKTRPQSREYPWIPARRTQLQICAAANSFRDNYSLPDVTRRNFCRATTLHFPSDIDHPSRQLRHHRHHRRRFLNITGPTFRSNIFYFLHGPLTGLSENLTLLPKQYATNYIQDIVRHNYSHRFAPRCCK